MAHRTIKLQELVREDAEPRVSKERIGLYDITTTSRPIEIPLPFAGEPIVLADDPLSRVRTWLDDILRKIGKIRAGRRWRAAVKAHAERCSVPATRLHILLRGVGENTTHNGPLVAQAIEIAAELADEWQSLITTASLEKPIKRYRNSAHAGRANLARGNTKAKSDSDAQAKFTQWCGATSRRAVLEGLTPAQRLQKYLKIDKPRDRLRRRLRAMLKAGQLK